MRKEVVKNTTLLSIILLVMAMLSGCLGQGEGEFLGKIVQKGSDTMVILQQKWAEVYMLEHPEVIIEVSGGGSGTGIAALINGTCDIANSSRKIKEKEIANARENEIDPFEIRVAMDGIAVVVHPSNPVKNLSTAELEGIFTGEIENWSEVGGEDHEIVLYGRQSNSGTYVFFKEQVLEGKDYSPKTQELAGSAALAQAISQEKYGIAYFGIGYVKQREDVKAISVNGIEPTDENISSGRYPISRFLYLYTNSKPQGILLEYIKWILSSEGQNLVLKVGYVNLSQSVLEEELAKLGI
ncbi:MAG: PstS family phosphate ABC transporter substrate-binding protein [Candidatus Methanofastidiosia archaeon]